MMIYTGWQRHRPHKKHEEHNTDPSSPVERRTGRTCAYPERKGVTLLELLHRRRIAPEATDGARKAPNQSKSFFTHPLRGDHAYE